ncbi:MAG TPA: glycosyltransferase family 4 protein [Microbacteriaceae bacterium]|jgi:glycosyltransferase involved in cell wall biosynthesis|nr:glycosyltransferase family 4 protein [Microbacteriaceae bacterium]
MTVGSANVEERKPRLLVLNQYYWPGFEATAHLLHELCSMLTDEFDVTVVTGMLPLPNLSPGTTTVEGVTIVRVPSTAYERSHLSRRGLNYVTYLLHALRVGWRMSRPDVIFCMTDPPMVADVGLILARRFRRPLVVTSQDVFPEVAVELGRLESPLLVGLLRKLVGYYLARADRVIAIGETMRARLEEKGAPSERLRVISNWVQASVLTPRPRDNAWAREHDLVDKFVVMHSGNVGHAQDLDSLVRAATFLRDLERLRIVIVGAGARHAELVALAERLEVDSIRFLPYQDREVLSESLSAADLHIVGLARGLSGYVVPSRMYGVLAVGRPVLVAAEATSETAKIVESIGCGIVVPPGRPELITKTIREAYAGEYNLEAMGVCARRFAVEEADRSVALERYRAVFREVIGQ